MDEREQDCQDSDVMADSLQEAPVGKWDRPAGQGPAQAVADDSFWPGTVTKVVSFPVHGTYGIDKALPLVAPMLPHQWARP